MTPTHRNGTPLDVALRLIVTPPMWMLGRLLRHWTPLPYPYPEPVAAQTENSSTEGRMRGGRGADTPRPRDRTAKEFSQ